MSKQKYGKYISIPKDPEVTSVFTIIILFIFFWPAAVYFLLKRGKQEWTRSRYKIFRRYASIIGNHSSVDIDNLAMLVSSSPSQVIIDLQEMIDKGFMGRNAYIDRRNKILVIDPSVVETGFVTPEYEKPEPEKTTRKAAKTETIPKQTTEPDPYDFSGNEEFREKLREIQRLDEEIADEAVSEKIDRIGRLTASIFRIVQNQPERMDEVRKFMNYYLPATFKLLKSYSLMEKQSFQGENIRQSRKKIEDVLDSLVHAFEQQLDRLFHAEAMDVDTDISVLETMMTSDGLIDSENTLRMRAGAK